MMKNELPNPVDNRDAVLAFLETDGEVVLTEEQKKMLDRWTFADEMIRSKTGLLRREEIATIIKNKFDVSRVTAFKYMKDAEIIFSSSNPLNKKYLIQQRIEFLQRQIKSASDEEDYSAVASLEKVLCNYIEQYPDYTNDKAKKTFIFNIDARKIEGDVIVTEDAEAIIEEALKLLPDAE